jgi:hypothetical protein
VDSESLSTTLFVCNEFLSYLKAIMLAEVISVSNVPRAGVRP